MLHWNWYRLFRYLKTSSWVLPNILTDSLGSADHSLKHTFIHSNNFEREVLSSIARSLGTTSVWKALFGPLTALSTFQPINTLLGVLYDLLFNWTLDRGIEKWSWYFFTVLQLKEKIVKKYIYILYTNVARCIYGRELFLREWTNKLYYKPNRKY